MVSELVHELMQSKLPSLTIQVRASLRFFEIERVVLKKDRYRQGAQTALLGARNAVID